MSLVGCLSKNTAEDAPARRGSLMNKILVADDDEDICTLLHALLTDEGFQVTLAHTGAETLDVLKREGGWLIFLDLMMPQITGQEVLQQLHHAPALLDHNTVV